MRYEFLTLNISTAALDKLLWILDAALPMAILTKADTAVERELTNLANECRARLQRRDLDPNAFQNLL